MVAAQAHQKRAAPCQPFFKENMVHEILDRFSSEIKNPLVSCFRVSPSFSAIPLHHLPPHTQGIHQKLYQGNRLAFPCLILQTHPSYNQTQLQA
ncbi:MAG: hypothetical protein HFG53_17130 [Lachnospiraceae bacterium]|nr:hypothetical protein [Lachnospiraceae bacterium]